MHRAARPTLIGPISTSREFSHSHSNQTKQLFMENENQKPVHEIKIGAIKATIWANSLPHGTRHNVTLSRVYKQGEEWKQTTSFHRDDLLVLAKAADAAHSWIHEHQE